MKRDRLEERRNETRDAARLRARCERIRTRTNVLDAHGVPYELLFDDRAQVEWIWRHFPLGGGLFSARIDWSGVAMRETGPDPGAPDAEAAAWLARLTARENLRGDVVLLNGNGVDPAICMELEALVSLPQVVTCDLDVWIVSVDGGWLIEFLRSEESWRWGRASAGAEERAAHTTAPRKRS